MAIEQQITADADLYAGATVYNKTAAADGMYLFEVQIEGLDTDASTLTFEVVKDGRVLDGSPVEFDKAITYSDVEFETRMIRVENGDTVTIELTSSDPDDNALAGIVVTVNPRLIEVDLRHINGALTDGTPDVDDRPVLSLQQLRCECDIADEGALHCHNANVAGYGCYQAGGYVGCGQFGLIGCYQYGTTGCYQYGVIGCEQSGTDKGLKLSGVVADLYLAGTGSIIAAGGVLLDATSVAGKTPAEAEEVENQIDGRLLSPEKTAALAVAIDVSLNQVAASVIRDKKTDSACGIAQLLSMIK